MDERGFTLSELMIVVVVIAILAAVAFPNFQRAVEQGHWRAANDILHTVYSGEQVYRTSNNTYVNPAGCGAPTGPWRCIYMDDPNGVLPMTFAVVAGANTFTVTATRNGGPCNGMTQTLNENRVLGGTSDLANGRWC